MQGHNDVQDPETARQIFLCGIQNFEAARWEDESIIRQKEQEVMTTHDFYSVGPWLILHALSCADCQITTPLAGSVAGRIIAGEAVAYDDIMEVISHALKITNGDFIRCLTKPGLDDKPFIEGSILCDLSGRIVKINHKRVIHEEDDEYDRVNAELADFFNIYCARKSAAGKNKEV